MTSTSNRPPYNYSDNFAQAFLLGILAVIYALTGWEITPGTVVVWAVASLSYGFVKYLIVRGRETNRGV